MSTVLIIHTQAHNVLNKISLTFRE